MANLNPRVIDCKGSAGFLSEPLYIATIKAIGFMVSEDFLKFSPL